MFHRIRGLLRALFLAVVVFFLLFFFAPDTSESFLGTSFRMVRDTSTDALWRQVGTEEGRKELASSSVEQAKELVGDAMTAAGSYTDEQKRKVQEKLADPAAVRKIQDAAAKGGQSLKSALKEVLR